MGQIIRSLGMPGNSFYRKKGTTTLEHWYSTNVNQQTTSTSAIATGTIFYYPVVFSDTCVMDRIGLEVTTAGSGGSVIRIGIYDSYNCLPQNLVLDAGTVAADSTGVKSITIDQPMKKGLYFFALHNNTAVSVSIRAVTGGGSGTMLGVPPTIGFSTSTAYYTVASAYATFASTAVTPTTKIAGISGLVYFRLSS